MKVNRLHHAAIICSNYEKSKDFYVNILGLEIINETYRESRDSYKLDLRVGEGDQIELFSFKGPPKRLTHPEAAGLRHLAFEVDNIDSMIEELKQKGVPCEPVRMDPITGKRFTFFIDPDKLPLELYEK